MPAQLGFGVHALPGLGFGRKRRLGLAIGHQLHRRHQSQAAHIAHVRPIGQGSQPLEQPAPQLRRPRDQPLGLEDVEIRQGHGAADRMSRISMGVHPPLRALGPSDRSGDSIGYPQPPQGKVAASDPLGKGH